MAYTPQTWTDSPSTSTPLSAARLTVIENGIASAASTVNPQLDFTAVTTPAAPSSGTRLYTRTGTSGLDALAYQNNLGLPIVLGRDVCFFAKNITGSTIAKGSVVYIQSASTSVLNIAKSQADAGMTKLPAVGIVAADVLNNTFGLVMQNGVINNVNTGGMGDGSPIYVDPTTAGAFTATRPAHPLAAQMIGEVVNANTTTGILLVTITQHVPNRIDGVNGASWAIGDGTGSGAKTIAFKNSNTGTLTWTPTATRTITLPDGTGTVYISGGTDVPITDGGTGVSTLPSGLLKGAGTGAITAATAGTDYLTPSGSAAALTSFPTLNQNTTGSAATLTTARTINGVSFNGSANIVVVPRIGTTTSSATPSIDCALYDQYNITALAANITSVTVTNTFDGCKLLVRITGTATRTISWGSSFQSSGVATLLATTSGTLTHLVGFIYDSVKAKFVCMAVDATGY